MALVQIDPTPRTPRRTSVTSWQRLAPGLYVVRLTYGERRLERRVVVVR